MTFHRGLSPNRRTAGLIVLLAVAGIALSLPLVTSLEAADDIDLLRENAADPFVMVLIDTSGSMGLAPPQASDQNQYLGDLVAANGDDPASKLFQTKRAVYEVFSSVENVAFGLATFNRDHARVVGKHWLYEPLLPADFGTILSYPTPATRSADGTLSRRQALEHFWVFGSAPGGATQVGTCANPIGYSTQDRDNTDILLNRFPKVLAPGNVTRMWIEVSNATYLLEIEQSTASSYSTTDADGNTTVTPVGNLGSSQILVDVSLRPVTDCSTPDLNVARTISVPFLRYTDFLMVESDTPYTGAGANNKDPGVESTEALVPNGDLLSTDSCTSNETIAGFWNVQDFVADGTCGSSSSRPFSGLGREGNWDSGLLADGFDNFDPYCGIPANGDPQAPDDLDGCYTLRWPTDPHPKYQELDSGDFIPMDWNVSHREDFLKRINPRHPDYLPLEDWDGDAANGEALPEDFLPYFGIARFFEDTTSVGEPGPADAFRLRNEGQRPLVAYGNSPLNRALGDIRCWYLSDDANKCRQSQFAHGFEQLFRDNDLAYKCRLPYLIVITDGEDNAAGENPTADINTLDGDAGVRTWVFTFNDNLQTMQSIISTTGATVIPVSSGDVLRTRLEEVVGQITSASRTFATAAVPSVQTAVQNQIYLTKFQPLNNAGVWEGHLHAFSRPMPQNQAEVPNRNYPNHVWDAALAMLDQSSRTLGDLQIGDAANQRRVLFARERIPGDTTFGGVPAVRQLFDRTTGLSDGDQSTALEQDFWTGLDILFDPAEPTSVREARDRANAIVEETLVQKQSTVVSTTDDLSYYILGEVFHSNPLIVGGPVNTQYFVEDAEETFDGSGVQQGTGYREFFNKHENRRKMVIAGANDGMIHAFDAGRATVNASADPPEVEFNTGTGREIFSYIPRSVLPTVKLQAENAQTHRWSVDGTPAAGDVFIDPKHNGTPTASDREWRTVVVTGLREGGAAYFALDVTHPDPLVEDTIGPLNDPIAQRDVFVPADQSRIVPPCYSATGDGDLGCDDELLYPEPLWEFDDRIWDDIAKQWLRLDEEDVDGDGFADGNGLPDLGETWSTPSIGRIRVVENGDVVNKYVAIFGGGLDPEKAESQGTWLYIVDIETGEAIYKRELEGSAPSDPAAVDTDQDGYVDRVYIGTTASFMYRIDLAEIDASGDLVFPVLRTNELARAIDGQFFQTTRIERGSDPTDPLWEPRKIFDANIYGGDEIVRRPFYFPPAVLLVADLGEYALAFGNGDRDDLASIEAGQGRFYVFVDETDQLADADLPMVETRFEEITRDESDNPDLLTNPDIPVGEKGWYLVLNDRERLIGEPFGFSGITFFATFEPEITASCAVTTNPNDPDSPPLCTDEETPQCNLTGTSRIYVVGTTDGDAFLEEPTTNTLTRSYDIEGNFVTNPFTEQAVTSTTSVDTDGDGEPDTTVEADPLSDAEKKLVQKLMELFPRECKFGNHRIDIKVVREDSAIQRIATVPICIVEKNWKEVTE